jgi:hypothetical protein
MVYLFFKQIAHFQLVKRHLFDLIFVLGNIYIQPNVNIEGTQENLKMCPL